MAYGVRNGTPELGRKDFGEFRLIVFGSPGEPPVASFFDLGYRSEKEPEGYFLGAYYVETLLESDGGLMLDIDSRTFADVEEMNIIRTWLQRFTGRRGRR